MSNKPIAKIYKDLCSLLEQPYLSRLQNPRGPVKLIAVSKTQPPESIEALYHCGQRSFGENYAQELLQKAQSLAHLPELHWIFIGRLQSNKIDALARTACEIQSLCSFEHARLLAKAAVKYKKTPYPVYLLVNSGEEAQKSGLSPDEARNLAAQISTDLPELKLRGIMAIPPQAVSAKAAESGLAPQLYLELRALANSIGDGRLSLGMSQDLLAALSAGSDVVRVGSKLFGARPTQAQVAT